MLIIFICENYVKLSIFKVLSEDNYVFTNIWHNILRVNMTSLFN